MTSPTRADGEPVPALRIGELAAATELTPDTLRYYERLGLLAKPQRSAGGFRLFGRDAVERVRFVKQAQALGLALKSDNWLVRDAGRSSRFYGHICWNSTRASLS